jgi:trans-2-enoyl-CoA reductase
VKGATAAGTAVSSAANKFKTPAIAAGAGLVGVAGGIALARGSHKKKFLGVSLPNGGTARSASKNLAGAAKNVGKFAERTGRVAEQVRVASEAVSESDSRSKSPVEVVLEGLTTRSHSRAG